MRFAAALFALAIALTGVDADLVAFSGFNCEGDEGDNVVCPKYCYEFGNRNSFAVLAGPIVVSVYTDTSCSDIVAQITNPGNGACSNVNIGTVMNAQSFTCNPDNTSTATTIVQFINPVTTVVVIEPSSTTSSTAGSTSTAKSSASSNKKILHRTGALLALAAGNLLVL